MPHEAGASRSGQSLAFDCMGTARRSSGSPRTAAHRQEGPAGALDGRGALEPVADRRREAVTPGPE